MALSAGDASGVASPADIGRGSGAADSVGGADGGRVQPANRVVAAIRGAGEAGGARSRVAVIVRAAAIVVFGPVGAGASHLQRAGGALDAWKAGSGGVCAQSGRSGAAARDAADAVCEHRGR